MKQLITLLNFIVVVGFAIVQEDSKKIYPAIATTLISLLGGFMLDNREKNFIQRMPAKPAKKHKRKRHQGNKKHSRWKKR